MGITEGTLIKQGRYWHWKYRCDGETRWESLKVETKGEAERVRRRRIVQYETDRGKFLGDTVNPYVEDFNREYFAWAEEHKRRKTIEIERQYWGQLFEFTRAKRLGDIRQRDIERFKSVLKRRGLRRGPLKDVSINDALRHLQAIFNHGIKLKLFSGENPVVGVARYRVPKTAPDFLSRDEIERVLDAARAHSREMHWVFLLGIYCGLRKNEIVNARWEWFDFDEKLVRVKRSEGFELKDSEERTIPMSDKVHVGLFPERAETGYLFESGRRSEGKHVYRYDPKRSFRQVAQGADVPRVTFQLLRHTFGSQHAIAGTSIYKISKWLGHSSVDVTARHYAGLQAYDEEINRF